MKDDNTKIVDTKMLFRGKEKKVEIMHNGTVYILQITKDDKLVLTK